MRDGLAGCKLPDQAARLAWRFLSSPRRSGRPAKLRNFYVERRNLRGQRCASDAEPNDVFQFVNLDSDWEEFDISDPASENFPWQRVHIRGRCPTEENPDPARSIWFGRNDDHLDESLYRMLGGRWVLVFDRLNPWEEAAERHLPLNRELTPKEACFGPRWINEYRPPVELRELNSHVVGNVPVRLERDWKPASATDGERETNSRAKRTSAEASEDAAPRTCLEPHTGPLVVLGDRDEEPVVRGVAKASHRRPVRCRPSPDGRRNGRPGQGFVRPRAVMGTLIAY